MHRNTLLHATTLSDLIVSDERRAWILKNYPPDDVGRPGLLVREVSRMARTILKTDPVLRRVTQRDERDSEILPEEDESDLRVVTGEDAQEGPQSDSEAPNTEAETDLEVLNEDEESDLVVVSE